MDDDVKYIRGVVDSMREDVTQLRVDVGSLKTKASMWGAIAGFLSAAALLAAKVLIFV